LPVIRVILSLESTLVREAVRKELELQGDICVSGEVSSPAELLCTTVLEQADAVILESDDGRETPGVLSHLLGEFPHIVAVVVGRHGDCAKVYRQRLCEHVFEGFSLSELLTELRSTDREYWAPATNGESGE
jgi:DNA-binding NarL/FixJ family response regulator